MNDPSSLIGRVLRFCIPAQSWSTTQHPDVVIVGEDEENFTFVLLTDWAPDPRLRAGCQLTYTKTSLCYFVDESGERPGSSSGGG